MIPKMMIGFIGFEILSGTVSGVSIVEKLLVAMLINLLNTLHYFTSFTRSFRRVIFDVYFTPKIQPNPKFGINMWLNFQQILIF